MKYSETEKKPEKRQRPERYVAYYRTDTGAIGATSSTNQRAMQDLQQAANRGDMSRIDRYNSVVMQKSDKSETFRRIHEKLKCIVCRDSGILTAFVVKEGREYQTGYACVCQTGAEGAKYSGFPSITDLTSKGLYTLKCGLADKSDHCHLNEKPEKCNGPECPKFGTRGQG